MISFKLFLEKCQAPLEVLTKYKDDPNAFISFTNIIEPRAKKYGISPTSGPRSKDDTTANKKTTRIGLNPLTSFDTPAGVYTYPVKEYWDYIETYDIHYVKEMPYVYVIKPKNPDRCARVSTYTEEDFNRDFSELKEIYPQYKLDAIINSGNPNDLVPIYPNIDTHAIEYNIFIGRQYRTPPLRLFWSITRSLAHLIMHDLRKSGKTKTKHITVWTHILRQFYDGIIDDTGSSVIHTNEPFQAVFWTNAQFNIVDFIDRTCGNTKTDRNRDEWTGKNKQSIFGKESLIKIIDNAYMSGSPEKLNTGIKTILDKKGLSGIYEGIINGDQNIISKHIENGNFVLTNDLPKAYYELAIKLYLKYNSGRRIFNNRILNQNIVSLNFLKQYHKEITPLIIPADESAFLAYRLLSIYSKNYTHNDSDDLIFLLRVSSIMADTAGLKVILEEFDDSELLKSPKLIVAMVKTFEKYLDKDRVDSYTVENLISLVSATKTKNKSIWRRFFPYFTNEIDNPSNYTYSYLKRILDLFLNADTGVDDELREYINKHNTTVSSPSDNPLNDIWKQYYGVDLFKPVLSQYDTIRKARHLKPTPTNEPTKTPSDAFSEFTIDDVIVDEDGFYYKIYNIQPNIIQAIDQDGESVIIHRDIIKNYILHDPENPLYAGDEHLKVGDKVEVDEFVNNVNKVGTIIEYHPFRNYKYKVNVNGHLGSYKSYDLKPVNETNEKDTKVSLPSVDSQPLKTNDGLKAGDELICILPKNTQLTKGKTYVVISLYEDDMVEIVNDSGDVTGWFTERFIKAPSAAPTIDHKYKVDQKVKMEFEGKYIVGKILELAPPSEYDKLKNRPIYKILWDEDQDTSIEFEDSLQLALPKKKLAYKSKYSVGDAFLTKDGKHKYEITHVYVPIYQYQEYHKNGKEWEKDGDVSKMYQKTFDVWMTKRLEAGTHIMDVKI